MEPRLEGMIIEKGNTFFVVFHSNLIANLYMLVNVLLNTYDGSIICTSSITDL